MAGPERAKFCVFIAASLSGLRLRAERHVRRTTGQLLRKTWQRRFEVQAGQIKLFSIQEITFSSFDSARRNYWPLMRLCQRDLSRDYPNLFHQLRIK